MSYKCLKISGGSLLLEYYILHRKDFSTPVQIEDTKPSVTEGLMNYQVTVKDDVALLPKSLHTLIYLITTIGKGQDTPYSKMICFDRLNIRNAAMLFTGAGTIFLLGKTLLAMLRCPSYKPTSATLINLSMEYRSCTSGRENIPGELRRLLESLSPNLDDNTKRTTLHTITQCILLRESEAGDCTHEDLKLVALFLDDQDNITKMEALNALKAFTSIWQFKIKIQEFVPKIVTLVTTHSDHSLHVAGLRLLNGLNIPDYTHPLLRSALQNFMDILLMSNTPAQVQVLRFLNLLAQKEDLLRDVMNCRAPPELLALFQPSLPGNLLFEMLAFVEQLNEGRMTPQYQSILWHYDDQSLHEIFFGENSRLSDRLLSLIVHPEEEVQVQACKVILSLRINREDNKFANCLSVVAHADSHRVDVIRSSSCDSSLSNNHFMTSTLSTGISTEGPSQDESGHNFHSISATNETEYSFYPLDSSVPTFQPLEADNNKSAAASGPVDFHHLNSPLSDDSDAPV